MKYVHNTWNTSTSGLSMYNLERRLFSGKTSACERVHASHDPQYAIDKLHTLIDQLYSTAEVFAE